MPEHPLEEAIRNLQPGQHLTIEDIETGRSVTFHGPVKDITNKVVSIAVGVVGGAVIAFAVSFIISLF
jgi:hypothetical protein